MNKRILKEAIRAFGCLEQMDPQDADAYSKLVETIDNLTSLSTKLNEDWTEFPWWEKLGAESKGEVPEMVLEEQTTTQPEAEVPWEEPESPFPEPDNVVPIKQYNRVEVRQMLAEKRVKNGINVSELLREVAGVDNFTACPDDKLAAVVAALEAL